MYVCWCFFSPVSPSLFHSHASEGMIFVLLPWSPRSHRSQFMFRSAMLRCSVVLLLEFGDAPQSSSVFGFLFVRRIFFCFHLCTLRSLLLRPFAARWTVAAAAALRASHSIFFHSCCPSVVVVAADELLAQCRKSLSVLKLHNLSPRTIDTIYFTSL